MQSTTEWKENMKREFNRLIDAGFLNPTAIVTFGKQDYQNFMENKQVLTTEGVSDEDVTCELHNSQDTNSPSACDRSQSHFDVIKYHDDSMLSQREETSINNNCSDSIYFREDMLKARLGKKNSSSPDNSNHDDSESTAFEPSSPHYLPDSEAPSDVKSTYTLEIEKYLQTTSLNDIDTIGSTHLRRKYDQFNDCTWQHNLNHPVDFPTKRHKAFDNSHFDLPEMIYMAADDE